MKLVTLTILHKFIRQRMFETAQLLARAAPEDMEGVRQALAEIAGLLHGHAEHEDARFVPLLREVDPALAERLESEHHSLHAELEAVRERAAAPLPGEGAADAAVLRRLYLDWNRFLGNYFIHLDAEEREMVPALGDRMPGLGMFAHSLAGMEEAQRTEFLDGLRGALAPLEYGQLEQAMAGRSA